MTTVTLTKDKKIKPSIKTIIINKLLCKFAGYFNGQMYRFSLNHEKSLELKADKTFSPLLLIVSRNFYKEEAQEYPIENKAELKKLLTLEQANSEQYYYHIWGNSDGKSQVNKWLFNHFVPNAIIKLPETLLFALITKKNQVTVVNNIKLERSNSEVRKVESSNNQLNDLFVGRSNNLIHSVKSTALVNSSQRFAMSVGVTKLKKDVVIKPQQIVNTFALAIKSLPFKVLINFIQKPNTQNKTQWLTSVTIPFLLVFSFYLASSSGYLSYKNYSLQQTLASKKTQINTVLDQQQHFDQQLQRYYALQNFLKNQNTTSSLWLVIADLFPQVNFTNIRIAQNRFVLRGTTEKATDLLEKITNKAQVQDAKFDYPTRKSRTKEVFVISFMLKSTPITNNLTNKGVL